MKKILFFVIIIMFFSCNLEAQPDLIQTPSFSEQVNSMPTDSLPFRFDEHLFRGYGGGQPDVKIIWTLLNNDTDSYYNCENSVSYKAKLIPSDTMYNYWFKKNNNFKINFCKIIRKFKLNNNTYIFLASSKVGEWEFLVVFTYRNSQIVDHEILGSVVSSDDYNELGLSLSTDYVFRSVHFSSYEGPPAVQEKKLQILADGKIQTIYAHDYEVWMDSEFHDYDNDYKSFPKPKTLSIEERKRSYKHLLQEIPEVELPYSSSKFYHLMEIKSLEEGKPDETKLFYKKLNKPKNIKYFFDKNANTTAFEDGKEGDYFYPIFRFQRTDSINIIGFLYQSYCNHSSAIYVKLNSYNTQGEIIESFIADRRFLGADTRFLSNIKFERNFVIKLKRYIQDLESYYYKGYEGFENYKDEASMKIINEKYFISENGNFKKINN